MKQAYCVQWKTSSMSAPAFTYFGNAGLAQEFYESFEGQAKPPRECEVPSHTPLSDVSSIDLANAFEKVAAANHYMVGVTFEYTDDELDAAEQILIDRQNATPKGGGPAFRRLDLALDLVELARKDRQAAASQRLTTRNKSDA